MSPSSRSSNVSSSTDAGAAGTAPAHSSEADVQRLQYQIDRLKFEISDLARRSAEDLDAGRQAIARELHDNFGQFLTVLDLEFSAIIARADTSAPLRESIVKLKAMAQEAHHDVDRIVCDLRPLALDGSGLGEAFARLLDGWSKRSSLTFDLHVTLPDKGVPAKLATLLYRILQEAITNVARHAKATRVGVILQSRLNELKMIIEDDGIGFDADNAHGATTSRLGLIGMHERLALVGGSLEVESARGKGTTLLIQVPQ
jgi:signal transduction histidine kinase